jgi:acetolactate synthase-1/2/3 large subunit
VVIPELEVIINSMLTEEIKAKVHERKQRIETENIEYRNEIRSAARNKADEKLISPDWLCHCINEAIDEEYILVNQIISHSSVVAGHIDRTIPGSLISCAGGSIQWALGASLGAKLASPDRMVMSLMTDGGFIWGCPVATLWSSLSYDAPFLSIIFNNRSYGAIRRLVQGAFGEFLLSDEMGFELGVDINPPPNYARVAEACGAYGCTVDNPQDIRVVLQKAIEEVKKGKPAVVDVQLSA